MPGAMTIKEVVECMEAGADIVKVFPGDLSGPDFIKAIRGPLPQAHLMPTGGVSVDNVQKWIKAGAYESITTIAKQFIEQIKLARN